MQMCGHAPVSAYALSTLLQLRGDIAGHCTHLLFAKAAQAHRVLRTVPVLLDLAAFVADAVSFLIIGSCWISSKDER